MAIGAPTINAGQNTLEQAALAGNLDMVRQFVAMSESAPFISGELFVKLLDKTDLTVTPALQRKRTDVASYLFSEGIWNSFELMEAIRMQGNETLEQWLFRQKHAFYNNETAEGLLRYLHALDELRKAFTANDVDALARLAEHFQAPNSSVAMALDYVLPTYVSQAFKRKLRKQGQEDISEYLSLKAPENFPDLLSNLLIAPTGFSLNALMLVKILELGADLEYFEQYVQQPIEQWCEENNCEDVLLQDGMQPRLAKLKVGRILTNLSTTLDISKDEDELLAYAKIYGAKALQDAYTSIQEKLAPRATSLVNLLGRHDLIALMAFPGVLPSDMKSTVLHDAILELANEGHADSVDVLISHAKRYRPDALRFGKNDLEVLNTTNPTMAMKLRQAFEPVKPSQSLYSKGLASVKHFLGFDESTSLEASADEDEDNGFCLDFKMMF